MDGRAEERLVARLDEDEAVVTARVLEADVDDASSEDDEDDEDEVEEVEEERAAEDVDVEEGVTAALEDEDVDEGAATLEEDVTVLLVAAEDDVVRAELSDVAIVRQ